MVLTASLAGGVFLFMLLKGKYCFLVDNERLSNESKLSFYTQYSVSPGCCWRTRTKRMDELMTTKVVLVTLRLLGHFSSLSSSVVSLKTAAVSSGAESSFMSPQTPRVMTGRAGSQLDQWTAQF